MNNQIDTYQRRLFNKLFATLPSIKRTNGFKIESNINFEINHFFYFKNKDFWFANDEKEDKYYFLFGLNDKPINKISGNDTCLIIDFDKNIQFNDRCLGLFCIINSEIHILINNIILKERYPDINMSDFKIGNLKVSDYSLDLEIIDLGDLDHDFIDNIEKLIKASSMIKSQIPRVVKTDSFGNKNIIDQMNIILEDLSNGKSEDEAILHAKVSKNTYKYWINRGKQDFGDVYVQFNHYINEFKSKQSESQTERISDKTIEEKVTLLDDGIYEPLLPEYEDLFNSMNQTGIAWVDKIGDTWNYSRNINGKTINLNANTLSELYKNVKDNDLIWGIRDYDRAKKFIDFPDDFEIPKIEMGEVFGEIDRDIYKALPEEYEKSFSSMNQSGIAWVNQIGSKLYYAKSIRGKNIRLSGENVYDLYEKVKKVNQIWGIRDYDRARKFIDFPEDFEIPSKPQVEEHDIGIKSDIDPDIYTPLPDEYEISFKSVSMNKSGIAWVNNPGAGTKWIYERRENGKTIRIGDEDIYELFKKVKDANQIWGIRDYDKARKFIDIPDDFEIPLKPQVEEHDIGIKSDIDPDIYAPLPVEYESSFSSMNQTGIAWVNQIGKRWVYSKKNMGNIIKFSDHDIYRLYVKVKDANQIWGIRDYSKASKYINIPKDFEIPKKQENKSSFDNKIDKSIYAPLSQDHLSKFNPNHTNRSGIAWVNKVGNKWFYQRQRNGKTVRFSDSNIIKLHEKVISNNQIWGIIDFEKARKAIETNSIDDKQNSKPQKTVKPIKSNSKVTINYIDKSGDEFEILIKGVIKNKDLMDVLLRLESLKENIKRIITNSINNESDIFIELEVNRKLLSVFEEKVEDLGWKINK